MSNNLNDITKERLKKLRNIKGITQQDFSEMIGMSVEMVGKMERGANSLSIQTALKIKDVFGVSLDWLYGTTEDIDDEASTILLALNKYFKIKSVTFPNGNKGFYAKIDENLLEFMSNYYEAEQKADEMEMPIEAKEIWLNRIKEKYNTSRKNGIQGKETEYFLSESKKTTLGAKVATPPIKNY